MFKGKIKIFKPELLADEANPIEWEAPSLSWTKDSFDKHRYVFCEHYKKCLDYAAYLHWDGWSCNWCEYNPYKDEKEDVEYQKKLPKLEREEEKTAKRTEPVKMEILIPVKQKTKDEEAVVKSLLKAIAELERGIEKNLH